MIETQETATALAELEKAGSLSPVGLNLPDDITPERFEAVGYVLRNMGNSLHWAYGDYLSTAERLFGEEGYQYGEVLGLSEVSRMQYIRVALRVPEERRKAKLSWSHHRAVAPLEPEDQERWLDLAIISDWNKSQLEDAIKRELRGQLPPPPGRTGYVVEAVATAAEKVWESAAPNLSDPGTYIVPQGPMEELAYALGETTRELGE